MGNYLPSKKFVFVVAVTFVVVSGFFVFFSSGEKTVANISGSLAIALGSQNDQKDSDNDGLYDWEEKLLGTDPFNPDTTGNGIMDSEEFGTEKIYPDIKYEELGALYGFAGESESSIAGVGNLTDSLTREATYRYDALRQAGDFGEDSQARLIDELAQDFEIPPQPDYYTNENIATDSDISTSATNAYTANVLLAFENNAIIYKSDPVDIVEQWLETQDEKILTALSSLGDTYSRLAQEIGTLSVPKNLIPLHLELANSIYNSSLSIKDMAYAPTDPIRSLLGTASFLNNQQKRQGAIVALGNYYKKIQNVEY